MSKPGFTFKRFHVDDSNCAMKVGTDGVLLGAWANCQNARSVLDIGTGSGLIALMIAQRNSEACIVAIDIDENAAKQSAQNFTDSSWANRLQSAHSSLQDYRPESKFDLIISNPPYFESNGQISDEARNKARHDSNLALNEILEFAATHLGKDGMLAVVLPFDSLHICIELATAIGLKVNRRQDVLPIPEAEPKRVMLELARDANNEVLDPLVIEDKGRHQYSNQYIALTKDFYLKM